MRGIKRLKGSRPGTVPLPSRQARRHRWQARNQRKMDRRYAEAQARGEWFVRPPSRWPLRFWIHPKKRKAAEAENA
jgi:hypothetical protein